MKTQKYFFYFFITAILFNFQIKATENSKKEITTENKTEETDNQSNFFDTIISALQTTANGAKQFEVISADTEKLLKSIPTDADTETYFNLAKSICSCYLNAYTNCFKEKAIQIKNIFEMKKEDLENAKDDTLEQADHKTLAIADKKYHREHDLYQKALSAQKNNNGTEALTQELNELATSWLPTYLPQFIVNTVNKKFDAIKKDVLTSYKQEARSKSNPEKTK